LDGRAVHKELTNKENVPYKAWVQLDFQNKGKNNNFEVKQFHENYGFDLKEAVGKYAITELKDSEKEKSLLQSLQKRNIQSVTIEKDGNSHKIFIEANPQFKSVSLYDGQMKRVQKEALEQYKSVSQSQGKEVKQEKKEELKPDVKKEAKQKIGDQPDGPKKKNSRKKGMSV
jgi:preprotein translocase subunit SecF